MSDEQQESATRRLLAHLGVAMVATGEPVHEVEQEVREVAATLGHDDTQVAAGPTGVTVALAGGEPSTFLAVRGPLRLDQAVEVRTIRHHLVSGHYSPTAALEQLRLLRDRPPRYPPWLIAVGWVGSSVGIALILQPGVASLLLTLVGASVVFALVRLAGTTRLLATLLPTVAAFLVACLVFGASAYGLLDSPLRTLLPPLAVLLPGAVLVTGMSELAVGSMVAGTARLGFGIVQLLLFTLGIVAAAGLFGIRPDQLGNVRAEDLGWWSAPVGLLVITVGISLMESVQPRLMPWILLVVVLAFGAQSLGQALGGAALGGFLGAVAATLGAALAEMVRPQLARLVVFLPGFWLLVPGSLGLLSVTQLAIAPTNVVDTGFAIVTLVCSIALGLLVGAAVAGTLRAALSRRGWRR